MDERTSRSRTGERVSSGGGGRQGSGRGGGRQATDIRQKEEEYKRLNEELEAKTADLVREAEEVMRGQEATLSKSRLLDNINTDDFLKEFDDDLTATNEDISRKASSRPPSRPNSKLNNKDRSRPSSRNRPGSGRSGTKETSKVKDSSEAFMTELGEMSLTDRILQMEQTIGEDDTVAEDVLPDAAQDMGSEATIRFLKAKLRVMQEEVDHLAQEIHNKDEESRKLGGRLKEVEEERGRHMRTVAAQQQQIDKYRKMADNACAKSDAAEQQLATLRKEVEQMKRSQKQTTSAQSATEVRLNRALEDATRLKEQLQKAKMSSKDTSEGEKRRVEQLMADNKRLEKQKSELMAGFKKQLKLIDILKRQKMHIEAAKMLQFSEEEFVKALEWGN